MSRSRNRLDCLCAGKSHHLWFSVCRVPLQLCSSNLKVLERSFRWIAQFPFVYGRSISRVLQPLKLCQCTLSTSVLYNELHSLTSLFPSCLMRFNRFVYSFSLLPKLSFPSVYPWMLCFASWWQSISSIDHHMKELELYSLWPECWLSSWRLFVSPWGCWVSCTIFVHLSFLLASLLSCSMSPLLFESPCDLMRGRLLAFI